MLRAEVKIMYIHDDNEQPRALFTDEDYSTPSFSFLANMFLFFSLSDVYFVSCS